MTARQFPNVTFIVLTIFAAACGADNSTSQRAGAPGSPPAASQPVVRDACALVGVDEAAKILGSAAKATPRSSSAERSTCDYVTESYESFTLEAIWMGAESEIKIARSAAITAGELAGGGRDQVVNDVMGLHRVENLGDEAYFSRRSMSYVRKGDVLLIFQNAGLNEPARDRWAALARAALARL